MFGFVFWVTAKMYIIQDKGGAIALMLAALCFLGTWPALLNLVERRGRNLMHTYLDYSITNLLVAIIFALTLGQIGSSTPESPNFVTQLHQVVPPPISTKQTQEPTLSLYTCKTSCIKFFEFHNRSSVLESKNLTNVLQQS
jgi:hypothetical protein